MKSNDSKTIQIAGTAIFSALVVVFDYTLKFSGLKIPFPWLTTLKFDFTGIPIVLALLFYGFASGSMTSIVAFLAILARSGNFISASMKGLAEFSQVLGMSIGLRWGRRFQKTMSLVFGIVLRCVITSVTNIIVLPMFHGMPLELVISLLPLIALFNAIMGAFSILVGYLLYETYTRRVASPVRSL